jgi:sRNA-binding carbon storage regulator CsrA
MLKLSRRIGEVVILEVPAGGQVAVVLLEAKSGRARLAFDAPLEVRIVPAELLIADRPSRQKPVA